MVKYLTLAGLALVASACTTVRTFDRNGDITGTCRIRGLFRGGGQCVGYANDDGVARRDTKAFKAVQKTVKPVATDDLYTGGR